MKDTHPVVQLNGVGKVFRKGPIERTVLKNITLDFLPGTFTALMGPSGSGKSTLLNCAAGLDQPTYGTATIGGRHLEGLSAKELAILRREHVGFIFQLFNLLPTLTVRENIVLPARLNNKQIDERALDTIIERVGLTERQYARPHELSGGQQQRVAIARALFAKPTVLFADEPTGALDTRTSRDILQLLREAAKQGQTIIMVTHDPVAAAQADKVLFIADGEVSDELAHPTADSVAKRMVHLGVWDASGAKK